MFVVFDYAIGYNMVDLFSIIKGVFLYEKAFNCVIYINSSNFTYSL